MRQASGASCGTDSPYYRCFRPTGVTHAAGDRELGIVVVSGRRHHERLSVRSDLRTMGGADPADAPVDRHQCDGYNYQGFLRGRHYRRVEKTVGQCQTRFATFQHACLHQMSMRSWPSGWRLLVTSQRLT
jgi:hypothetical protein